MSQPDPGTVTRLLQACGRGDDAAADALWTLLYPEIRQLAAYHFRDERAEHTLQPTAVVNEVYLRLIGQHKVHWKDKSHFMGACAKVIRRVLVDHARGRLAAKRGGGATRVTLSTDVPGPDGPVVEVLDLEQALERLQELDPRQAQIVELRFFGGLMVKEIAEQTAISEATVKREWAMARAWLFQELVPET